MMSRFITHFVDLLIIGDDWPAAVAKEVRPQLGNIVPSVHFLTRQTWKIMIVVKVVPYLLKLDCNPAVEHLLVKLMLLGSLLLPTMLNSKEQLP